MVLSSEPVGDETEALRKLAKDLNDQFETEVAVAGSDASLSDLCKVRIPTTSFMLNLLLGGGIPQGRILEVFGDPSHGKSTLIQHMMCGVQQFPGISVLLDAESGWHKARALKMGHNSSRHLHLQADTVELAFSTIFSTITRMRMAGSKFPKTMPVGFFYDTLSASQTEGEKSDDQYADGMADKARKIRQAMRRLSLLLPSTNCFLIVVNQQIQTLNAKGAKKTTPGGGSVKFWSSKRLSVFSKASDRMNYPEPNTGIITSVRNIKDKLDMPHREINLPIRHLTGIDPIYEIVNFLIDHSPYVNMKGTVTVPDYPEDGDTFKLGYQKQVADKMTPELLEYLKVCAEEVWNDKFGGQG